MSTLILVCLLVGCERAEPLDPATLESDPARLHALHRQCAGAGGDKARCSSVEQAELQRLLSGRSTADEYRTLAELPSIPASFDEPMETQP
jgi:hypothetical protein